MRCAAVAIAVLLATTSVPLLGTPADASTLSSRIDELAGSFTGGAAIWIADPLIPPGGPVSLAGGPPTAQPLYAKDPDRPVVTASLYKLALLAEAEHRVELGQLRYDDRIVIELDDITDDGSFVAPGTELTLDEALEQMITVSDNGTAMHLWRTLGPASVNAFLEKSGIAGFRLAVDPSEDNVATARGIGTYFTLLAKRQLVSAAASDRMLQRLGRQQINDRIPARLPPGTAVAHKTGNLAGLVHDAGVVFTARGPRVVVAMTWDADDGPATDFIAHLASAVHAAALEPPTAARYGVPPGTQYVEPGSTLALGVTVENAGQEAWTLSGAGRVALSWELRDTKNKLLARAQRGLPLGVVAPGDSTTIPVIVPAPSRPGDARVVLGLVDGSGRDLAALGVATATIPVRVQLPFVVDAVVRIPSLLHRREASMVEVSYTAHQPIRGEDHDFWLGWRFIDPVTDRVVAQGEQRLGLMKTYQRTGTFFAPLVAPNVRGTYVLEHELRERGFVAGATGRRMVEIGAPRSYGDEIRPARGTR